MVRVGTGKRDKLLCEDQARDAPRSASVNLVRLKERPNKMDTPQGASLQIFYTLASPKQRAVSSVGSEHYLDKVGVTGSNPVLLTLAIL